MSGEAIIIYGIDDSSGKPVPIPWLVDDNGVIQVG